MIIASTVIVAEATKAADPSTSVFLASVVGLPRLKQSRADVAARYAHTPESVYSTYLAIVNPRVLCAFIASTDAGKVPVATRMVRTTPIIAMPMP